MYNAFRLIFVFIYAKYASSSGVDDISFRNTVVEANSDCGTTRITTAIDQFDAGAVTNLALSLSSIASQTSFDFVAGLNDESEYDELYTELKACIDANIDAYRVKSVDDVWRGLMTNFTKAMEQYDVNDMDALFDLMNGQIDTDFGAIDSYTSAEGLLFLVKVVGTVYWYTFTMDLGSKKKNQNYDAYNNRVSKGRGGVGKLKKFSHDAIAIMKEMYSTSSSISYDTYWGVTVSMSWSIKWKKGGKSKSGVYGPLNSWGNCREGCFEKRIEDEFNTWINEIERTFIPWIDDLYNKAHMIGKNEDPSYWQATVVDEWFHCLNIAHYYTDIAGAISNCNNDDNCVGFSWNEAKQRAYTKKTGCSTGLARDEGTGWRTVFKETYLLPTMFRSVENNECLEYDTGVARAVSVGCHGADNQWWIYNRKTREIISRHDSKCLEARESDTLMIVATCDNGDNQKWVYNPETKAIRSLWNDQCVTKESNMIYTRDCNSAYTYQQWAYTNGTATAANVSTFILIGLVGAVCLCVFIGICMKVIVGLNKKQLDVKYKVVDDSGEEESIYKNKLFIITRQTPWI